jgi:hydroxymethylglutaryl-CoA lyase
VAERVEVVETLRDAWQGLPHVLSTADKLDFVRRLIEAGFTRLDVGSFVSPRRVPTMADTGELLGRLCPDGAAPDGVRLTALVASVSGLERLLAAPGVGEVLYPFSLSETFQRRNTGRGREEACALLADLTARAHAAGRALYATVSMAFGNNEGEPWEPSELRDWVDRLRALGVDRVGLADTTAQATPEIVARAYAAVVASGDHPVPGAHLHVTPAGQGALVDAALDAGCRSFDAALGGLGGCQFAHGAESNVSTLGLARRLAERGYDSGLPLDVLPELDAAARRLATG